MLYSLSTLVTSYWISFESRKKTAALKGKNSTGKIVVTILSFAELSTRKVRLCSTGFYSYYPLFNWIKDHSWNVFRKGASNKLGRTFKPLTVFTSPPPAKIETTRNKRRYRWEKKTICKSRSTRGAHIKE